MFPVLSHQSVRKTLERPLLADGPMLSEDLGAFFFKSKAEVWSAACRHKNVSDEELQKSCHQPLLLLLSLLLLLLLTNGRAASPPSAECPDC
jgi:hypothetical protein